MASRSRNRDGSAQNLIQSGKASLSSLLAGIHEDRDVLVTEINTFVALCESEAADCLAERRRARFFEQYDQVYDTLTAYKKQLFKARIGLVEALYNGDETESDDSGSQQANETAIDPNDDTLDLNLQSVTETSISNTPNILERVGSNSEYEVSRPYEQSAPETKISNIPESVNSETGSSPTQQIPKHVAIAKLIQSQEQTTRVPDNRDRIVRPVPILPVTQRRSFEAPVALDTEIITTHQIPHVAEDLPEQAIERVARQQHIQRPVSKQQNVQTATENFMVAKQQNLQAPVDRKSVVTPEFAARHQQIVQNRVARQHSERKPVSLNEQIEETRVAGLQNVQTMVARQAQQQAAEISTQNLEAFAVARQNVTVARETQKVSTQEIAMPAIANVQSTVSTQNDGPTVDESIPPDFRGSDSRLDFLLDFHEEIEREKETDNGEFSNNLETDHSSARYYSDNELGRLPAAINSQASRIRIEPHAKRKRHVKISYVKDSTNFYVQLQDYDLLADLAKMRSELWKIDRQIDDNLALKQNGYYVLMDQSYRCRARLIEVHYDGERASIFDVDTGDTHQVKVMLLQTLPDNLLEFKEQAIHCYLKRDELEVNESGNHEFIRVVKDEIVQLAFIAMNQQGSFMVEIYQVQDGSAIPLSEYLQHFMSIPSDDNDSWEPPEPPNLDDYEEREKCILQAIPFDNSSGRSSPDAKFDYNAQIETIPSGEVLEARVAVMSWSSSPDYFYIHPVLDRFQKLDQLEIDMDNFYSKHEFTEPLCNKFAIHVGSYWACKVAKYVPRWHRVKVVTFLKESSAESASRGAKPKRRASSPINVLAVDYGESFDVCLGDLRPLTESFSRDLPAFAVCFKMHGVEPIEEDWSTEFMSYFNGLLTVDRSVEYSVIRVIEENYYEVQLYSDEENPNRTLVDFALALAEAGKLKCTYLEEKMNCISPEQQDEEVSQLNNFEPMAEAYNSLANNYLLPDDSAEIAVIGTKTDIGVKVCKFFLRDGKCKRGKLCNLRHVNFELGFMDEADCSRGLSPDKPEIGKFVYAMVTTAYDPGHFFVILPFGRMSPHEVFAQQELPGSTILGHKTNLEMLNEELNVFCNTRSVRLDDNTAPLMMGSLVAAKHPDNSWYRARVMGDTIEGHSEVFFVDSGLEMSVVRENIRLLPPEYRHLPCQAICCILANVRAKNDQWSDDAKALFRTNCEGQYILLNVLAFTECQDAMYIEVYVKPCDNDQFNLGLYLTENGQATTLPEELRLPRRLKSRRRQGEGQMRIGPCEVINLPG